VSAQAASRQRPLAWRHPQWWLVALAVVGWTIVLTTTPSAFVALCLATGASENSRVIAGMGFLAHWLAMVAAMMLPLALPMARHVAARSLWRDRHRAMGWFALGYLTPWMLAGAACGTIAWLVDGSRAAPIVACVLAAMWHWTPARRAALRRCHRILPVAPGGHEGRRSCLAFGLFHGGACVTTCASLMVAVVLAGHHPAAMAVVALVTLAERFWQRLPQAALGAVPLALAALQLS
jgi:predicted metal-binding membrane protein